MCCIPPRLSTGSSLTECGGVLTFTRMRTAGLIDLQVNGYAGVDFNDRTITADALGHALSAMRGHGIAHCLPTLITAPESALAERLAALDAAVARCRLGPEMVLGYHLEGPFLNPEENARGCHSPDFMRDPDAGLIERLDAPLQRKILLLTLAPERTGAPGMIRWAAARGKLVALGHTNAGQRAIDEAASAGACLSTHLGNALRRLTHKFDNPLMAQLAEDRLAACVIADGLHVPPFVLRIIFRAKGINRCILVTDATAAAGAPAGQYEFAGNTIERGADGSVRMPGTEGLAGSALTLDQAVRNVVAWGLATEDEALAMASTNPARVLRPALAAHGIRIGSGSG